MKHILYLYFLLFSLSSVAQQNLPLKFQEDVVKWSELIWMDNVKENNQSIDYGLVIPPIVDNDTIYLFNNYKGLYENNTSASLCGFVIKKLNRTTGQKYWEVQRNYTDYQLHPRRKSISVPELRSDGNLVVTLCDESEPRLGRKSYWEYCYPAHMIIDGQKGIVIDSHFVDYADTSLTKFVSNTFLDPPSTNARFYLKDSGYLFTSFDIRWEGPKFTNFINKALLDFNGKIIRRDTIDVFKEKGTNNFRYFDINKDSVGMIFVPSFYRDSFSVKYSTFDRDFKILDSTYLSHHFVDTFSDMTIQYLSPTYFILATAIQDWDDLNFYMHNFLFNSQGKFIDKLNHTLRDGIDNGIIYGWLKPIADIINNRIILTHSRQNKKSESSFFELRVTDGDDNIVLKRIHVDGIRDHFRSQWLSMMDNGDILLLIEQFNVNDPAALRWFSWIMLDGAKMGIVTKTKDTPATQNHLKLYPNPTTGIVTIETLDTPAKVDIYDLNGSLVQSVHNVTLEVNIDNLPSGVYILNILNNQINERHKIIKIE
ncbi:MAG: T9SS type A sorting domain-containing protein [Chitinophagales bacterium]|nr:T9SS type A sorting domain-containing protein [Chitinophagales bacterium]